MSQVPKKGRPAMSAEVRREIIGEIKRLGKSYSRRAIARKIGYSTATISKIVEQEALSQYLKPYGTSQQKKASAGGAKRVNLSTVAAKAGVSVATASMALRGNRQVAPATRERVQQAAKDLNYQVHPYVGAQLAAVRRGRVEQVTEVLAYLYAPMHRKKIIWSKELQIPWGPRRLFQAGEEAACARGYRLEYFPFASEETSHARLANVLKARGIRGILLDAPTYRLMESSAFPFEDFRTIAFRDQNEVNTHVFSHDHFLNYLRMFCHLWLLGYRRIGLVMGDALSMSTLYRRDAAFRHAQYHLVPEKMRIPILHMDQLWEAFAYELKHKKPFPERSRVEPYRWLKRQNWSELKSQLKEGDAEKQMIQDAFLKRWIEQYQPEVIMGEDVANLERLNRLGYRVPQDIALAHGKLNEDVASWSGIRRADEGIGKTAVDHLCNEIDLGLSGMPEHPFRQRLEGEWVPGKTTRKIRKPLTPLSEQADRFIKQALARPIR